MILNKDRQKFVKAVAILFILQGLAWFSLALAGIVVKKSPPNKLTRTPEYTQYTDYLAQIIYNDFMIESTVRAESERKVIRPPDFEAFLWIYVVLSAVWVAASLDQIFAIKYKKSRQSHVTLVLGVAILLTSIIDLVFVALLGRDLATCPFLLSPTSTEITTTITTSPETTNTITTTTTTPIIPTTLSTQTSTVTTSSTEVSINDPSDVSKILSLVLFQPSSDQGILIDCKLANGIVITLAARGYVLLLINVVLAVYLIKIGARALKGPTILTYQNNPIPRIRMPESKKTTPSPSNEMIFYGDSDVFPPPAPSMNSNSRNRMPAALNNRNQNIYY